ncbi:hypothetical protein MRB53_041486 [Persea americana]|nr:hypothetical protein MRB53_041486 [Persea americana]
MSAATTDCEAARRRRKQPSGITAAHGASPQPNCWKSCWQWRRWRCSKHRRATSHPRAVLEIALRVGSSGWATRYVRRGAVRRGDGACRQGAHVGSYTQLGSLREMQCKVGGAMLRRTCMTRIGDAQGGAQMRDLGCCHAQGGRAEHISSGLMTGCRYL